MVVVDDGNAILVASEILVLNCGQDLLHVEGSGDGLQFSARHHVLTIGTDINTVRALAAGNQINDAGRLLWVNDLGAADRLELSVLDCLLRGFPVHRDYIVAISLGGGDFELPSRAFRVIGGPEGPTFTCALSC